MMASTMTGSKNNWADVPPPLSFKVIKCLSVVFISLGEKPPPSFQDLDYCKYLIKCDNEKGVYTGAAAYSSVRVTFVATPGVMIFRCVNKTGKKMTFRFSANAKISTLYKKADKIMLAEAING